MNSIVLVEDNGKDRNHKLLPGYLEKPTEKSINWKQNIWLKTNLLNKWKFKDEKKF